MLQSRFLKGGANYIFKECDRSTGIGVLVFGRLKILNYIHFYRVFDVIERRHLSKDG